MSARLLIAGCVATVAAVVASAAMPATKNDGPPDSIAALGDSITLGPCNGNTCSWSTGTSTAVDSHLLRLRAIQNRPIHAYNLASGGFATMADLQAQAREAVARKAQYVTIELGENDLCSGTPLTTFRSGLERGLAVFTNKTPPTKILLLSIENLAEHWRVLHADPTANAFNAGPAIDCGLGSTTTRSKLAQLESRTRALNQILAQVCSEHPLCLYDNGTYFHLPLKPNYFVPGDYQHLAAAGQHALAAAEWKVALKILYQ